MEVSVIIPVYNAVDYIDQSIRSALHQPEVVEVIVIDDGSADGSFEKLQKWDREEPKIKLLTHPGRQRKRAAATRNLGLKAATAEFIAFLDADDYYLPNRFDKTAELFQLHSDAEVVLESVQKLEGWDEGKYEKKELYFIKNRIRHYFFESILLDSASNVPINGICFKRKISERVGLMDESLEQKQDKDFLLRMCLYANIKLGDKNNVVAYYRHHSTNTTSNMEEERKYQFELFSKWKNKLNHLPLSFKGKLEFIRQYMVSKYETRNWSYIMKIIIYPILFLFELFNNLYLFTPFSRRETSFPS